jgi:DMSO reductase anchor subunit
VFKLLLALHVLTAIFAVGPLVQATTTASRGLRTADAGATASSARTAKIYAYVSLVVVILGFGLMSMKSPSSHSDKPVADFADLWIWLSVLLWVVAVALTLAVVVPSLEKATATIGKGEAVSSLTGRVAAAGGVVGLIFAVIVFLMVYRP